MFTYAIQERSKKATAAERRRHVDPASSLSQSLGLPAAFCLGREPCSSDRPGGLFANATAGTCGGGSAGFTGTPERGRRVARGGTARSKISKAAVATAHKKVRMLLPPSADGQAEQDVLAALLGNAYANADASPYFLQETSPPRTRRPPIQGALLRADPRAARART